MARVWYQVRGCRCGFCEKTPAVPLYQTEPDPDSSKRDPHLNTAKPTSKADGSSVITCLRKGKNAAQQLEKRLRICERNSSADANVTAEGAGAPGT